MPYWDRVLILLVSEAANSNVSKNIDIAIHCDQTLSWHSVQTTILMKHDNPWWYRMFKDPININRQRLIKGYEESAISWSKRDESHHTCLKTNPTLIADN